MSISTYLKNVRSKVGHDLLVLPSAAVVLTNVDGGVLFGLHADKNVWVIPGGLVEPGELPADAAVREFWEESGLLVELTSVVGIFGGPDLIIHYPNGDVASYVATVFRGRAIGGELKADGKEILELRYLSQRELKGLPHAQWVDAAITAVYGDSREPDFQKPTWKPF